LAGFVFFKYISMNIIVNGGSRGIGKELVLFLSQNKENQIIVTARDKTALILLKGSSRNIYPVELDLSFQDERFETFYDKILEHFDSVDVMINMAGALVSRDFMKTKNAEARLMMETNFFGPAALIASVHPLMRKGSHILNISSMGGYQGSVKFKGLSYYSASKAAIACLTECLAEEFKEDGIAVNCLALGAVQTEMLAEAFPGYKAPVNAGEIAPFIAYFALNGQKFMNGKIIPVAANNP
jgi:NAD(P)-dependent dehydrogenase (short-subunit alcohol dehydrogenase family)